jgi:hypothetical protein
MMYGLETLIVPVVMAMLFMVAIGAVVFTIIDVLDARAPKVDLPCARARRKSR